MFYYYNLEQFLKKKGQHSSKINEHELSWESANIYELCPCNLHNCWKYLHRLKILKDCVEKKILFSKIPKCHVPTKLIVAGFSIERHICTFCNTKFIGLTDFLTSHERFTPATCCVWYTKYEIIYMYSTENSI